MNFDRIVKIYHGCANTNWTASLDALKELAIKDEKRCGKRKRLDYGVGLYLTEDKDMAEKWALANNPKCAKVRIYECDFSKLKGLDLSKPNSEEMTLALLLYNHFDYLGFNKLEDRYDKDYLSLKDNFRFPCSRFNE